MMDMCLYFYRKVEYLNAKGFIKDPNTIIATLASGQQVRWVLFSHFISYQVTDNLCQYEMWYEM